jgi:hypothetical protein
MSRQRRAGSVRFDPYWKVQWWDKTSLTWRDIQRSHQTREDGIDAAVAYHIANGKPGVRLMRITENGRAPEPIKITELPPEAAAWLREGSQQ